ncbi:MAG: HD domain-containing protein [Candidatus Pacearchaeota archaeon]
MKEISYEEAEKLLLKHLEKQKQKNKDAIISHSRIVSDFLLSICLRLNELHSEFNIDCEKMRIAGLLHDIGKNGIDPDFFHAETGWKILSDEGLNEMAKIVRTHTIAKESAESEGREGFEPITLEEKLLTYADSHVKHDKVVTFDERFNDVIERSRDNIKKCNALIFARERIRRIVDEVDALLENKKNN